METTSLTFGAPLWFWLLAVLPLAALLFLWSNRRGRELVSKIVAPRLREQLAGSVSPLRRAVRAAFMLGALAFAVLALAQPRYGFIEKETKQKGRDVIVAIDTSRSMMATDVSPTRLARAKLFTQDLVRLMQGDRVGLIAFAGSAFLQAPLTLDYSAVTNALEELDTNLIPVGGTNLAAAINAALEAFGKAEGNTRALVVLTDGEELDADGIAAAKRAAQDGIRIFTVGIGSPEGSLIPIRLDDGRPDFVRDPQGKPVTSKLDESRLREIATATGGFYIPLSTEAARDIFEKGIVPMELAENGVFNARQPIERYQWPLAVATILLALSLLPGDRRRLAKTSAVLLTLIPSAQAQTGLDEFNSGNFGEAAAVFENKLQAQPGSRELQFNAGAAAYKTGDHEKAATHFTEALLSPNPKLREAAAYNLANTLVRKGEAAQDTAAKKTNWQNAIEQYDEVLQLNPDNNFAKENRDLVKKLLEELENQQKEQKQDQKQDENQQQQDQEKKDEPKDEPKDDQQQQQEQQQNQDQKPKEQDKKDSEQQEQDGQQGEQDRQEKEGKEPQEEEKKNEEKPKDQSAQSEQDPESQKKKQPQPQPQASPTPGDKKQGDLKSANEQSQPTPTPASAAQGVPSQAEEELEGRISPSQARALLNALRGEEEKVNLMETQQPSQDVLRDW